MVFNGFKTETLIIFVKCVVLIKLSPHYHLSLYSLYTFLTTASLLCSCVHARVIFSIVFFLSTTALSSQHMSRARPTKMHQVWSEINHVTVTETLFLPARLLFLALAFAQPCTLDNKCLHQGLWCVTCAAFILKNIRTVFPVLCWEDINVCDGNQCNN